MTKRKHKSGPAPPLLEAHSILHQILHNDAVAAVLLLCAALAAFLCANLPVEVSGRSVGAWYEWLWEQPLGIAALGGEITKPLHLWINDGLMAVFFFLVGLEIKRELLVGELASLRKAMLPIAAAVGGMIAPALIYAAFNFREDTLHGWGIPMATDIAFAAGVLGLLGKRVPNSLAVFLIALAIVDDLGSVLVIAVFYTDHLQLGVLVAGLALVGFSFSLARFGVRSVVVYVALACLIWIAFLKSGVHATVAGVLFAFTIPASARYEAPQFVARLQELLARFCEADRTREQAQVTSRQRRIVRAIEDECVHVDPPLHRIEHQLHPYSALLIMPIFAFANAGVHVDFSSVADLLFTKVTLGVVLGLVFGKQIGIMVACWLAVKLRIAELPRGVDWRLIYGLTCLAGIGFTMSLFIGQLAFAGHGTENLDPVAAAHLAEAKVGTLLASMIAGTVGTLYLLIVAKPATPSP